MNDECGAMSARRSGPSVKRSELAGRVRTAPCPQIVPISTDFPAWVRNRILRKPRDGVCASARNPDSGARIYKRTGSSFSRRCFSRALLSLRLRSGQALRLPGSSCQGQRTKPGHSSFPLSPLLLSLPPCPFSRGVLTFGLCLLTFDLRVRHALCYARCLT